MRNLANLFLGLLFVSVVISGCKEAEEVFYVNFPADYQTEFDITVDATGGKVSTNGVFNVTETIDPTTNNDYQTYIDNIKEVDILEVSGEVLTIDKDVMLKSTILNISNGDFEATWQFTDEPITEGTILVLDNNNGQWDAVGNIMLGKKAFTVTIDGETDQDDVTFTVLFSLKSYVTASPL